MTATLAHVSHTSNILNGYIQPTFSTYVLKQPIATCTCHVIAKYMLETYMLTTLCIYAKYLTDLYGRMNIHMKSLHQPGDNGHCTHI